MRTTLSSSPAAAVLYAVVELLSSAAEASDAADEAPPCWAEELHPASRLMLMAPASAAARTRSFRFMWFPLFQSLAFVRWRTRTSSRRQKTEKARSACLPGLHAFVSLASGRQNNEKRGRVPFWHRDPFVSLLASGSDDSCIIAPPRGRCKHFLHTGAIFVASARICRRPAPPFLCRNTTAQE